MQTPFREFTEVQDVLNQRAWIDLGFGDSVQLDNITLNYFTNLDMQLSDLIKIELYEGARRIVHAGAATGSVTLTTDTDHSTMTGSATFDPNTDTITITLSGGVSAGNSTFSMDVSNVLFLYEHGIWDNTQFNVYFTRGGVDTDVALEQNLPCVGICSATMTVATAKAGYATSYTVNVAVGNQQTTAQGISGFQATDRIKLYLPDFVQNPGWPATYENGTDYAFSWDKVTEILTVYIESSYQSSFAPTQSLHL